MSYRELSDSLSRLVATEATGASFTKWWRLLNQAALAITDKQLDSVLRSALDVIRGATDADAAAVWLREGSDEVGTRFAVGFPTEVTQSVVTPGEGMSGRVLATRQPLIVDDLQALDGVSPFLVQAGMRSAVAVPILNGDEVLGVLHVDSKQAKHFGPRDGMLLEMVSDRLAISISHVRVFESERRARAEAEELANRMVRVQQETAFLAEVSALFGSSLDLAETLSKAAHLLVPTFADMASVYLFDDLGVLQRVAVAHKDSNAEEAVAAYEDERGYEARSAMLTVAAINGRAMIITSEDGSASDQIALDEEHRRVLSEIGIRSSIAVALVSRGETLGLLGLMRLNDSPEFDDNDLRLAEELGRRAAVSIDNALIHQRRAQVARALQASLLPPALPDVPGVEIAAAFHPAGKGAEVGGDFYDLFPLGDDHWVILIGDVSGSGPAAAALTAQVRHGARVAGRAGLEPAAVVSAVNATLDETTGSEWFCTMVYAQLSVHSDGADLQIICAGHPPPLILRGSEVEQVESHGPLLGVLPTATFGTRAIRLGPSHSIVLVTDGALEARAPSRTPGNTPQFFGEKGLREVLVKSAGLDAEGIVREISEAVLDFSGGELSDDMAILVLRASPK